MLILLTNNETINNFLRKRFRSKEVYTVQVALDFLAEFPVKAIVLSEFIGDESAILSAVTEIRKAGPTKIIYIAREVSEEAGRALFAAGVMIVEGEFTEELLVSLVEQYYPEETVKRFALSNLSEDVVPGAPTIVRQRVLSFTGGPGSGKSVIASCLARAASKSAKTLLVDLGDFPRQHIYFDMKGKYRDRNLDLYAVNLQSKLADHLVEIGINLYVLPGSVTAFGETKILPQRMRDLIREAKENFDVIIFDCSPHLNDVATNEAIKAGDVFLVTAADNCGRTDALKYAEYLPDLFFWVENRFLQSTPEDLYLKFKHKMSPSFRFPLVDVVELQQALDKGRPHPVLLSQAGRFAEKMLGLKTSVSVRKWPRVLKLLKGRHGKAASI